MEGRQHYQGTRTCQVALGQLQTAPPPPGLGAGDRKGCLGLRCRDEIRVRTLAGSPGYQFLGCLRGEEGKPAGLLNQFKVQVNVLGLGGQARVISTCLPFLLSGITFP